jgi:hypothetical protein
MASLACKPHAEPHPLESYFIPNVSACTHLEVRFVGLNAWQVPCEDPVVLIGGGYISLEAAAGIVSFAPHLKVID